MFNFQGISDRLEEEFRAWMVYLYGVFLKELKGSYNITVVIFFSRTLFEKGKQQFCGGFLPFFLQTAGSKKYQPGRNQKKHEHVYLCQGLNSHYFHIIGDGHQPNSRGLYTHYKDSVIKVGRSPIPNIATTLTMAHLGILKT